jgi:hypothetical protein
LRIRFIGTAEQFMARNFGVPRPLNNSTSASVWPLWIVAFMAVGVINAATFLHR